MKNTPVFDDSDIIIPDTEDTEISDIEDISEYEEILFDGEIPF